MLRVTTAEAPQQKPQEEPRQERHGAFAALTYRDFRLYLGGQLLANTGTWMRSIAQDWLVYALTHSSTAVGMTIALQFLPLLVLGMHTGALADRLPKRHILILTQVLNAVTTAALAAITIAGTVRPVHVYAFALLSGVIFAYDSPARQAFVADVVPASKLRAAISLTAAVFQSTRLIGPAAASLLIQTVGTGWVFAVNALCYVAPTIGLLRLKPEPALPLARHPGALRETARYVRSRPDVAWTIFLVGMLGNFGLNFPITLTAMARSTFHGNAGLYGLFNVVLAIGSAAGAVLAGAGLGANPRLRTIAAAAAAFGLLEVAAAGAPDLDVFLVLLIAMGLSNLAFQAMSNALVQLAVDSELRGRVMALYLLVFIGGTPVSAPFIGALTNHF